MGYRFFALVLLLWFTQAVPAQIVTQTSTVRGVTVAATAGNLSPEASVWDFAVVLSSTGKALPDDLVKSAVLVDPQGRQYKALIWEGAPHSGTHRAGVLKFIGIKPRPDRFELRIQRPGESRPRKFSWFLSTGLMASADNSRTP
ncbi:MAG: hypothetical protein ABI409_09360 [Ramlibacter sp.]